MFYYYGGKKRLASLYPKPEHRVIVEPFAGSAAYSMYHLKRGGVEEVVLYEKDYRVVELWDRLLSMSPEEVLNIQVPPAGSKTSDFFIMTSATGNAVAKCKTMTVTSRMPRVVEIMKSQIADTLRFTSGRVTVHHADYSEAENIEATWFIDPPYQVHEEEDNSKTIFQKGRGYAKGCTSDEINFLELGDFAKTRSGQTIVAEQHGADWLEFQPLTESNDSLGKSKREVFWHSVNNTESD